MLKWMEQCPKNVLLLRGNHEEEFASYVDLMLLVDRAEELGTDFLSHTDTEALYESMKYLLRQKKLPAVYFDLYGTIGTLLEQNHVTLYDLCGWSKDDAGKDCVFYDIDCVCAFRSRNPEAKLACIRLEDEKYFIYRGNDIFYKKSG